MKLRFDWNVSNNTKAYVRVARDAADDGAAAWRVVGAVEVALPTPNIEKSLGRSYSGNVVSVLSPTMTNEAVVSYTPPDARQPLEGPERHRAGRRRRRLRGIQFPGFP